jgi:hypothetical protein
MKVNVVRSALKLQKKVLRHVTISVLKLSNLCCLYQLASPLTFLVILQMVLLFWTMTIPCLLPMRARLSLIATIPPSLLTLVVIVTAPGRMRELLLVVRAKAKGWGKKGMHFQHTLSLVWRLVYPNFWRSLACMLLSPISRVALELTTFSFGYSCKVPAFKRELESLYLSKVIAQDWLVFANLD